MSTLHNQPTLTARAVLFGSQEEAVDEVAHALDRGQVITAVGGVLGHLSSAGRQAVGREAARVAAGLAEVDLVDVCAAGWRKHTALRAAAQRSRQEPGAEELVDLATHRIESVHKPAIDLLVDGSQVGSIDFELRLEILVKGLVATVRDGSLTTVRSGRCEVTGRLSCEGITVTERQGVMDLDLVVHLGNGFSLLPDGSGRDDSYAPRQGSPPNLVKAVPANDGRHRTLGRPE